MKILLIRISSIKYSKVCYVLLIIVAVTVYMGCGKKNDNNSSSENSNNNNGNITFKVPDTGQTISYTATYGEDSDYTINEQSFTDNDNGTITDNVTGLIWQKRDDETLRTWDDAVDYCDDLTDGGYPDWRLPSKKEIVSTIYYEKNEDAIDTNVFDDTLCVGQEYWTSTAYDYESSIASWEFQSHQGDVGGGYKTDPKCVRCVRGDNLRYGNFVDLGNGIVKDKYTRLMWQKDEGGQMEWQAALSYCEGLSLANYQDWRLPNIKELESLVDDSTHGPAIRSSYFPNFPNAFIAYYWSSTAYPGKLDSSPLQAWYIDFNYGSITFSFPNNPFYVRCVRRGL